MISVEGLTVDFGARLLFDNVSYVINKRERVALVGKNGAGKSTMLKIIAGLQQPTGGRVSIPKDITIGYLPQHMIHQDDTTVIEEAEKAFDHIAELRRRADALNQELCERTDYESDSYRELIERVADANERVEMTGNDNFRAESERTLMGLGFSRSDFNRSTNEFSGGWRMRIELAKILLKRPDALLLDEPTNHLDIESIQWLENFLVASPCAVLLVSHDRTFLDRVTTRTIEISLGKIYDYKASYSHYVELRKERREQQLRAYANQQKEIQETEAFIERFRYKATKSVQVQSRIKWLEKLERIEVDEEDNSALRLKFPPSPRSGSYPLILEDVAKRYGDHTVFQQVNFRVNRGEKVAFVGKNGEGKTTLVKCIMGEIPFEGNLKIGHNVKIGYFAQNQASLLDGERTIFETIDYVATGDIRTKIRDILGAFMFGGEIAEKKVKVLSGGERSRLAMIRLLLEPVNLLILDEPTNHLDMRSKDVLKQAIKEYDGTAVIVSHDREFLDGLVTKVYEFGGGRVKEHLGGIYDFLEAKKLASLQELERRGPAEASGREKKPAAEEKTAPAVATQAPAAPQEELTYEQRKEMARLRKKNERLVELCEVNIAETEGEIKQVEEQIASGDADTALYERYAALKRQLEQLMKDWEDAVSATL